jgi:hypothetical protein
LLKSLLLNRLELQNSPKVWTLSNLL